MKILKEYPIDNEPVTQTLPIDIKENLKEKTESSLSSATSSEGSPVIDSPKYKQKTKVYEPRPLNPQDPVYYDIMEQFVSRPVKPKYYFEEFGDYWSCSCGHINKGESCVGCGIDRQLLRKLFILHKPADANSILNKQVEANRREIDKESAYNKAFTAKNNSVTNSNLDDIQPLEYDKEYDVSHAKDSSNSTENKACTLHTKSNSTSKSNNSNVPKTREETALNDTIVLPPKGNNKKKNIIIAAIIAIILAITGGGYYYYTYIASPAIALEDAITTMENGNLEEAIKKFKALGDYEDSETRLRDCYISLGDKYLKDKSYDDALEAYENAQDLKNDNNIKDKIKKLKFTYVKDYQSKGGDEFESYLAELMEINYPGITSIYNNYYAWHMKVVANKDESDSSSSTSTFSRSDTVYFHANLSGGAPNEKIKLYYTVTWPDGHKQTQQLNQDWKTGSKIVAHFSYPIALLGAEGKMTFKVYDSESNEEMGSCTVNIKD